MSILELFDSHSDELDHGFIESVDLNHFEENVVQDIMTEVSIPMTFEEEISELQQNGLLDLSDHSDLPCMPGIQATDVGSLLEQFEEVSQTLADCDSLEPTFDHSLKSNLPKTDKMDRIDNAKGKKEMTSEMLERLKSSSKRKTTVMLPMAVPAKRGRGRAMPRGRPVALPANCTPLRLQRVMMQNKELSDCLPPVDPENLLEHKERPKDDTLKANENYFEQFDHDYCKPYPDTSVSGQSETAPMKDKALETTSVKDKTPTGTNKDENGNEKITDSEVTFGLDMENVEDREVVESLDCDNNKTSILNSNGNWNKRNYRKHRAESPIIESGQYFDKLPTYFTALSIPKKPMRRCASDSLKPGICFQDFLERDHSPVRDTSAYSKLPDYYSTFTNSTRYDKNDKNGNYSQESKTSSGYSSRSQSPLVIDSRQPSPSRSRSHSHLSSRPPSDRSVSNRKELSKKRRSCSSDSRYSSSRSCSRSSSCSRSCSRSRSPSSVSNRSSSSSSSSCCSSRSCSSFSSRSRSQSPDRAWRRECEMRRERSRRRSYSRYSLSRSRSRSRSHLQRSYRHRSPSYSRSKARYSRSRSRSYSRGRHYRDRSRSYSREVYRSPSRERRQELRRKEKEEEKRKQNSERRIVYVGGIPDNYTKRKLQRRFERFGDIEHVQLHFREHGDNYGFVTFAYTCDAYAAIEKGNVTYNDDVKFDLCFGGRRQFCDEEYADLDGNKELEEEFDPEPKKASAFDFDELLRQARSKIKKS